jgi:dCTP deaminase
MKLSDVHILEKLASQEIVIVPKVAEEYIGSFSIDLRLGNHFRVFRTPKRPFIDLGNLSVEGLMESIIIESHDAFYLHPGELALGLTLERISLPNDIAGWLDGRSSLARLGLMVHITAHTIDPGWDGHLTLEFVNVGRLPLALRPGMRICAISFEPLTSPTSKPYREKPGAKYKAQDTPLASRITEEERHWRDC